MDVPPMDFPLIALLDEDACYRRLVEILHPGGLACPQCGAADRLGVHRRHRAPVLDYQCGGCGRVFNAFTGTPVQKTRRRCAALVLILRGICQGVPTARLARELNCDRKCLLNLRHDLQAAAQRLAEADWPPLPDAATEADEAYLNAGEKRRPASRPGRSATAAGQPGPRPRPLGHRPAAGRRGGRP
jgi:transposase-like protein